MPTIEKHLQSLQFTLPRLAIRYNQANKNVKLTLFIADNFKLLKNL